MDKLKVGIIGYGSIGKRHCTNLLNLGVEDITLFRSIGSGNPYSIKETSNEVSFCETPFDFIIISSPTSLHSHFLNLLIPLQHNFLIEKPIVSDYLQLDALKKIIPDYLGISMCAYNLRFHPSVIQVKNQIKSGIFGKIYSARFYVGQYLPDWHPKEDYRSGYSAKKNMGGGVVLDLIHEIDLATYLFGKVKTGLSSIVQHLSKLEIETEDIAEILYKSESETIVSIHLDYLNKVSSRFFDIIAEEATIHCDLLTAKVEVRYNELNLESYKSDDYERNDMYKNMIKYYINCLENAVEPEPSIFDAIQSTQLALDIKNKTI